MANPFDEIDPPGGSKKETSAAVTAPAATSSSNPFDDLDPPRGGTTEKKPPQEQGMFLSQPDAQGQRHAEQQAVAPPEPGYFGHRVVEGLQAPYEEPLGISKENLERYPGLKWMQPQATALDAVARAPAAAMGAIAGAAGTAAEPVAGPAFADRLQRDVNHLFTSAAGEVPRVPAPRFGPRVIAATEEAPKPPAEPPPIPTEPPPSIPRQVLRPDAGVDLLPTDVPHELPPERRALSAAGYGGPLSDVSPETIAHMRSVMEEQGFTPHTIEDRLAEMSAHHFFGEITPSLEADMGAVAAPPGAGKLEVMGSLRQRALEARERVQHVFDRAFGVDENISQLKRIMEGDRAVESRPFYEQFKSTEITPTPALDALMPRLEASGAMSAANRSLRIEGEPLSRGFPDAADPPGVQRVPTAQAYQFIKEALDDKISAAMRAGERNEARRYVGLKNDLISALDNHPNVGDVYRQARTTYAQPTDILKAIDMGQSVLTGRVSANELPFLTAGYAAPEMRGLRIGMRGYLEQMLGKRDNLTAETINTVLSPNNVQKLRWAIGDAATDQLVSAIEQERHMHTAPTRVHGGTPTALRLEAQKRWTLQPGMLDNISLGDVAHAARHPVGTGIGAAARAAERFGLSRRAARKEEAMARLRDEASRIFTLQGPERDAVARYLVGGEGGAPPRKRGGRVVRKADGGGIAPRSFPETRDAPAPRISAEGRRVSGSLSFPAMGGELSIQGNYDPQDRGGASLAYRRRFADGGVPEDDDAGAMMPETFVPPSVRAWAKQAAPKDYDIARNIVTSAATLPQRAFESAQRFSETGEYNPAPIVEAAMLPMGSGAVSGLPLRAGEAALGAGPIRAYHGSPHDFDAFDLSKVGSGEGQQVYGHGLYFADREGVARSYRDNLQKTVAPHMIYDDQRMTRSLLKDMKTSADPTDRWLESTYGDRLLSRSKSTYDNFYADLDKATQQRDYWLSRIKDHEENPPVASTYGPLDFEVRANQQQDRIDHLSNAISRSRQNLGGPSGRMYEVDLNADPEHMINWDAKFGAQSPYIQDRVAPAMEKSVADQEAAIERLLLKRRAESQPAGGDVYARLGRGLQSNAVADLEEKLAKVKQGVGELTGQQIYKRVGIAKDNLDQPRAFRAATNELARQDIPGLRYLDQGSRITGDAARMIDNYGSREKALEIAKQRLKSASTGDLTYWDNAVKTLNRPETSNYVMFNDKLIDIRKKYADGGATDFDPYAGLAGMDPVSGMPGDVMARAPVKDLLANALISTAGIPKRAIDSARHFSETGEYDPAPVVDAAMLPWGTGAIAGVGLRAGETALGAGAVRGKRAVDAPLEPRYNPTHETAAETGPGSGLPGGAGGVEEAQGAAARLAGAVRPLAGLPQKPIELAGGHYVPGPNEAIHEVAQDYMRSADRPYQRPESYVPVDPEHARAISKAYEDMPHAPDDPKVRASYDAMVKETIDQYRALKKSGLDIEAIPPGARDPYAESPRLAHKDVAENNHLWFFPTEGGFGTDVASGAAKAAEAGGTHPLLQKTGEKLGDRELLANDLFRIVHDYFGHLKEGNGFRASGEDNAWRTHALMYSDAARPAMTTETRGQNSWLNYGPHGDFNRTASAADTHYADQKVGLMPDWTMRDAPPSKLSVTSPREPVPVPVDSLIPSEKNLQWMKKYEKLDNEAGRETTVDSVRGALQRGEPIPPITVDADRNIIDGHHRWLAHKAEGKQEINAVVRPGEDDFVPPKGARYYDGPPVQNAGVDARPNKTIQTVADPHRMMFPGVYRNPREIAEEAASRVGPEDPAMKQLFGVTRGDLREMAQGRVGNEEPNLQLAANPRGSLAAQNIQTPKNTQRLTDILGEAGKHEGLRTADAWYIMDPVYQRMEQMFGPEEAARRYKHLNTMTGMASPGSDVMTEIQRGTGAHWLQNEGRFDDFTKYGGLTGAARQSPKVPADLRYIGGHPYHPTSQAAPMQKYIDTGAIQSDAAKVPLYVHASGVPETGFQTSGPVGDAHFSRGVGLADTRKGPTDVGSSFSKAEYQTLQPWWQHEVAGKVGLESVPAQARLWTALGPQTGVDSALGAPKLELLAKQIMQASRRLKITPEKARDLVLSGKAGAGVLAGAALLPRDDEPIAPRAFGGRVKKRPVTAAMR